MSTTAAASSRLTLPAGAEQLTRSEPRRPPELPAWMGVRGFVDIHFHLLWGVDDGPRDAAVSQRLSRLALETGTRAIVATPHYSARYRFDPELAESQTAALEDVCQDPALFSGCELEVNDETLRAVRAAPRRYCLAGSRYALVELPHRFPYDRLLLILELFRDLGLRPILAHPERYPLVWERPRLAQSWVRRGGLLQLTADSLSGRYGRRASAAAGELLRAGLAHFVASDAHDATKRPPDLQAAFRTVYQQVGQAAAARLFTHHPLAVLHDESLASA